MDRRHRQERQDDAGADHAEHVPEVRARPHLDVFRDVAENLPAFEHTFTENRQALLEQNDVGGFLGDVDGTVDRDADISSLEGRTVIDAVAKKTDDVPVAMQGINDRRLLRRGDFGEYGRGLGQTRYLIGRKRLDLTAENDPVYRQADFVADLPGDDIVVPRQDLHLDAAGLQCRNRRRGRFLWRVEKCDVAE